MFHPADPFPTKRLSYSEARIHSKQVDQWLGFRINEIEHTLSQSGCRKRAPESEREHQELWLGLAVQNLLTPYTEIRRLLEILKPEPGQTVIDLGAAYGRLGFVLERHFTGVAFTGYEFVGERVLEARRCMKLQQLRQAEMIHADLSLKSFTPISADFYFIYDFGTPKAIEKILFDLRRQATRKNFHLVARGKRCHQAISDRHPWLGCKQALETEPACSIYQSDPILQKIESTVAVETNP